MTPTPAALRATAASVDITVDLDRRRTVVTVRGHVDFTDVDSVRRELLLASAGDVDVVVVDLSNANLLDSTGAAALVHVQHICRRSGVDLRVVVPALSPTQRLLADCGLLGSLHVVSGVGTI